MNDKEFGRRGQAGAGAGGTGKPAELPRPARSGQTASALTLPRLPA